MPLPSPGCLRFTQRQNTAALVVKINKQKLIMEQVETFSCVFLVQSSQRPSYFRITSYTPMGEPNHPSPLSTGLQLVRLASSLYMQVLY
ncbi:hypothetical protein BGW80DRAFT_1541715 [Lactifluus volemus]|nr:hypothetical protein BGW80DRAFT_1525828 [Lactifluus volemus]KAH9953624.1 hypothetical protein BGW80DRAFT_1517113 [Lactifluus volemus]KAH9956832.1 hypothetical protein BGW80DRAFT_1496731 [Lactifluus volemus]KAH9964049.1 hypothetical protein BGW80DRAFT_1541715 [Lactifluus volemus]